MWEKDEKTIPIDGELFELDWILFFPQRVHWKWLMKELNKDPENFHSQLMNNPNQAKTVRFNRDILIRQTKVFSELNELRAGNNNVIVQSWDTAYSDNTMANYTVGLTCMISQGRYYIMDMVRGQYSDYDMPRVMAEFMHKWKPARVVLEHSNGVGWLTASIRREMDRLNFFVQIELSEIENKKNRKSIQAAPVAKLFGESRIILSNGIPSLDKMYDELEGFQNGAPNDDIVDAFSLLVKHYQYTPEASHLALRSDIKEEQDRRRNDMLYRHIYGMTTGNDGFVNYSDAAAKESLPAYATWTPYDAFKI
jgi:phage terminase large subunit-like protein